MQNISLILQGKRNSQAPPRVSPIGNNGFLFSRPRLKLIACGAGT